MVRWGAWGLSLVIWGCGPDEIEPLMPDDLPPPAWAAVCGSEGPHRILPLARGEHAYRVDRVPNEDRVMVSTFLVDPALPLATLPPTLDLLIHSTGSCGEDPIEVARDLLLTSRFGELHLACSEGGHGAWVIDPLRGAAPRKILDGWCPLRATSHGLLTVQAPANEDYGTLVLLRDPADPLAVPEPLAEGIRSARNTYFGPGSNSSTSLWAKGDEAIVLDELGVVWQIDLDDGMATQELEGVREIRISGDARWLVWQALDPTEGDDSTPIGPVFLRDRDTGTDAHLLNTHLEWTGNPHAGEFLVVRDDSEGLRVFLREGLELITLPAGTDYRGVLDDGALWLARRVEGQVEELRWIPSASADPLVFATHSGSVTRRNEGIEIFETDDVPAPNEGSLSFVAFAGGEPLVLADRVHQRRGSLADGRILTIVAEDETGHGPLRLIDPETGGWQVIEWLGYVQSPRLSASDPFNGDVVFAKADPGGDERGVYRGRVPRAE